MVNAKTWWKTGWGVGKGHEDYSSLANQIGGQEKGKKRGGK